MKIAVIATCSFPITRFGTASKTGDSVIVDLIRSLEELSHQVYFIAPDNSYIPNGGLFKMRASFGKYPPSNEDCETEAYNNHKDILKSCDIVHDFSVTKCITTQLYREGFKKVIQTIMGGAWLHHYPAHNLITWSRSHQFRVQNGYTDYWQTPTPDLAGPNGFPTSSHVVNGGIDTNFYFPTYQKKNYLLWLNRWHPSKGYKFAIELAKCTNQELVLAGVHPEDELFEYQKNCALEAISLAKGCSNIHFQFIPKEMLVHQIEKRKLYQEAKANLCTTTFGEPGGLTMMETLACGTPSIATNYGSMPETIENGKTGFVCKDDNEFIAAIEKINSIDPEICRSEAIKRFDRKVMAKSYLSEYQDILNGKGWA